MQTETNLRGFKERIILHRLLGLSIGAFTVFLFGFVLIPTLISEASAVDVNFGVTWAPISLTLDPDVSATDAGGSIDDDGHGDILFGTVIPSSVSAGATSAANGNVGTLKILKKTIGIETTGKYYTVYLSTNSSSNDLAITGDANLSIPAISSSFANPSVFSTSSWGIAIPGIETTGIPSTSAFVDSAIYNSRLSEELTYSNAENIYKNVTFSAVPAKTNPQQVWKATTTNNNGFGGEHGDTANDHFSIYYGLMVSDNVLAGTYDNSIVYTALAASNALDEVSTNLSASQNFGTSGDSITLTFNLAESANTGLITKNNIEAYLVKHADMVAADFDPDSLNTGEAITCAISDFTIDSHKAALVCTLPTINEIADDGSADANSSDPDEVAKAAAGRYDFWVKVNPYSYNYISKISDGTTLGTREAFAYVGLQSKYKVVADGQIVTHPYVTKMQEISGLICSNTNKWNNQLGDDAQIFDPSGTTALLAAGTDTLGISSFSLTDTRDEKTYKVRRLADGRCYTVQDLDLALEDFAGTELLTSENTDLNSKTVWNPSATAFAIAKNYDSSVTQENYFATTSFIKLGVSQPTQFQSQEQTGYPWGSKLDDNYEELDSFTNNTNAVIPRSYASDGYHVYNWYATVAESVGFTTGTAQDTICPRGWTIPNNWYWLYASTYSAAYNDGYGRRRLLPLSATQNAEYSYSTGNLMNQSYFQHWTSYSTANGTAQHSSINPNSASAKPIGYAIRCIARD